MIAQLSPKNILGAATLAAILLGGGTAAHLVVDSILQAIIVFASLFVLLRQERNPARSPAVWFGIAAVLLCLFQLLPLPLELSGLGRAELLERASFGLQERGWATISLAPGRTFDSLLWIAALTIYAAALASMETADLRNLIPFLLLGVLLNVLFALMMFAVVSSNELELFGYNATAAAFANRNHFGTLVFSTLIIAISFLLRRGHFVMAIVYCAIALTALFATASAAAALVGAAVVLLGGAMIFVRSGTARIGLASAAAVFCLLYFGLAKQYTGDGLALDTLRREAFATTFEAATANLPFGTGFGSFLNVYKVYETVIHSSQINHAHNEYLELFLEGGIAALILMIALMAYLALIFFRARKETFPPLIGLLAIMLHSFVDYPLRTFAISVVATLLLLLAERDDPWMKPNRTPGGQQKPRRIRSHHPRSARQRVSHVNGKH